MSSQLLDADADLVTVQLEDEQGAQKDLESRLEDLEAFVLANELEEIESHLESLSPLLQRLDARPQFGAAGGSVVLDPQLQRLSSSACRGG